MQPGSERFLRVTMAVLSVWWLGCQSYDSIAGYLRGATEVASCMSVMSAPAPASSTGALASVAPSSQEHGCGCGVDCIGIGAPLIQSTPLRPVAIVAASPLPGYPPEFLAEPLHPSATTLRSRPSSLDS